uniref:Uncharacterized protein n=1 Tax=Oryza rufipogon TaxID=4529 RepID=A0A0E0RG83_ORYRU
MEDIENVAADMGDEPTNVTNEDEDASNIPEDKSSKASEQPPPLPPRRRPTPSKNKNHISFHSSATNSSTDTSSIGKFSLNSPSFILINTINSNI